MGASGLLSYEDINPILLTPEILEKCGFVYKENIAHWANKDDDLSYYFKSLINGDQIEYYLDESCNYGIADYIKFIHQLQNLYFALSGEELEIKL